MESDVFGEQSFPLNRSSLFTITHTVTIFLGFAFACHRVYVESGDNWLRLYFSYSDEIRNRPGTIESFWNRFSEPYIGSLWSHYKYIGISLIRPMSIWIFRSKIKYSINLSLNFAVLLITKLQGISVNIDMCQFHTKYICLSSRRIDSLIGFSFELAFPMQHWVRSVDRNEINLRKRIRNDLRETEKRSQVRRRTPRRVLR